MRSVMKHQFSQVPEANIPRSSFNRSHGYKTTFDAGDLVPIFCDSVLPGDTFILNSTLFARMTTLLTPIMDNLFLDTFFFFVPNRLVYDKWQAMMGEQDAPDDTWANTDYILPTITSPATIGWAVGGLSDYLGLPTGVPGLVVHSLYHRAYNLIWNTWFRDQNLQDPAVVDKDVGPDTASDYANLLKRGKRHDYFTSCLPWPQKGPGVELPLGTTAPILGLGKLNQVFEYSNVTAYESDGTTSVYPYAAQASGSTNDRLLYIQGTAATGGYPNIRADLSNATAATINSLREAFQLQRLYERDARGGTRYTEIVRSHFGVISPDARLQRPEYLGGGSAPIMITPVQQTSESNTTPQGNLAAMGACASGRNGFTKSFTEHGVLIGMVCVRADLTYQQGIDRDFLRSTRFDFYWPSLAHLGEQVVYNKEIYAQGTGHTVDDEGVFGYQERYAEYRYKPSKITGKLRSTYATSLDVWHLSQEFSSLPVLGDTFIQEAPPIDRVVAVADEPNFVLDCYHDLKCVRPMPVYSVPGLIDHF